MIKKRKIILASLLILICGLIAFSTAYLISINNDGIVYSTKGKAKSGNPNITFTGENTSLAIQNAYPVDDLVGLNSTPYSFSVINNEKKYNVKYEIYLETKDGTSGYLSDSLVKFSLKDSQVSGTLLGNLTSSNPSLSSSGYTKSYLIATGVVANTKYPTDISEESISYENYILNEETLSTRKDYNMRLWIDESATVETAAGKVWDGKLVIKYNYEIPDPDQSVMEDPDIIPGYTEVAYLQSSGHQWIDTNFKPNQDTRVMIETSDNSSSAYWFGAWNYAYNNGAFALGNDGSNIYTGYDGQGGGYGTIVSSSGTHIIEQDKNITKIDNIVFRSLNYTQFQVNYNLYLFGQNRAGNFFSLNASFKLNMCQIYDNNIIYRNYVPCIRKTDYKPGLCDTVSKTIFANQGTGEFGYETLDGTYVAPQ